MRVRWLTRATKALIAAHDFLEEDNPRAGREFIRYVLKSVDQLSINSEIGRPGRVNGTRELVLLKFPYIVPYRVKGEEVQILHVLHSSRAWPRMF